MKLVWVTPEAEKLIVQMARVSSDPTKIPAADSKLLAYLITHKHWSPFQMASMCVELETSRAISAQLVRHRSLNVQEFCISGQSMISCTTAGGRMRRRSIESLYKLQNDIRWERLVKVWDASRLEFISAKVKEVFKTGIKPVYKVVLNNGKTIESTLEHKFLTRSGFKSLNEIKVGDAIGCNGQPLHQSKAWLKEAKARSIINRKGLISIAEEANVSYHTIRKWLKIHKLQYTKVEVVSYTPAWNTGLDTEQQPMYGKNMSKETRQKMQDKSRKGVASNLYVNGNSSKISWRMAIWHWQAKWKNFIINRDKKCKLCGITTGIFEVDHIKPINQFPELAKDLENLQLVCIPCHNEKSKKDKKQTCRWSFVQSIEYAGEQETYDMEIDHLDHNYIANGIITHNSQRYSSDISFQEVNPRQQDTKNRQNSTDTLDEDTKIWFDNAIENVRYLTKGYYENAIAFGIAKESARFLLPMCTTTKLYVSATVRDWITYLMVRLESGTQKEHRDIAQAIWVVFKENFPITTEVLRNHPAGVFS